MSDFEINSFPGKGFELPDSERGWVPLDVPMDLHVNTAKLVKDFAEALMVKLLKAQEKYGYADSWIYPNWMDECRQELRDHTEKGDPLDVAAYAAFLWYHKEPTVK